MEIPFNIPLVLGNELENIKQVIESRKIAGKHEFYKQCSQWFVNTIGCNLAVPTPSCTAALEMGLMLIDIKPGDEVILPSFTFTSTATAVVLHGGIPVFIDSRNDTLNMNEDLIAQAITSKTKAIIPMHYGGVSCDMNKIMSIAEDNNLFVLEDAAQCIGAYANDKPVGSFGHLSAFSFHETKNINCGEGGMLCVNDEALIERAEIARDKGTDQQKFARGEVEKYSWQDKGSSYLMSELQAAFLLAQLEKEETVTQNRRDSWYFYYTELKSLEDAGKLQLPFVPEKYFHNAHVFYILLPDIQKRKEVQGKLKDNGVNAVTHYVPLHSAPAGQTFGRLGSNIVETESFSHRLLRLPIYYGISKNETTHIIKIIHNIL